MIFKKIVSVSKNKETGRITKEKLDVSQFETPAILADGADKDGILYSGASYNTNRRLQEHLTGHNLITLDIDSSTPGEFESLRTYLDSKQIEYLYHTTTSHTKDSPRYRLILSPSRAMKPNEYAPVLRRIVGFLPIKEVDNSSYVGTQGMFLPVVYESQKHLYEWSYKPGLEVDVVKHINYLLSEDYDFDADPEVEDSNPPLQVPAGTSQAQFLAAILLSYKAQNLQYDEWLEVGMGLYHQTNGEAYDLWVKWSDKNPDVHDTGQRKGKRIHDETDMHTTWRSFKMRSGQLNAAKTLRVILNKKNYSILTNTYKYLLLHSENESDFDKLCNHISDDRFIVPEGRMRLAKVVKTMYPKIAEGETLSIEESLHKVQDIGTDEERLWAKEWYYNLSDDRLYNSQTGRFLSPIAFNANYTRLMPLTNTGSRTKAYEALVKGMYSYELQCVDDTGYFPGQGKIVDRDGVSFFNEFSSSNWPKTTNRFNPKSAIDKSIEEAVNKHTLLLAGGRPDTQRYIKQHLAHLRQKPHERIRVGLCITSTLTGVGKSVLKMVYQSVLGQSNTANATNTDLTSDFNGYIARPVLVTFFEEISLKGRDLFLAMEGLKENITEDRLSVRKMYRDSFVRDVTTCIVMFSNYPKILGEQGSGRRWTPVDVPYSDHDQVAEVLGQSTDEFYEEYVALIKSYPSRFAAYFDQVDLEGFDCNKPHITEEKELYLKSERRHVAADLIRSLIKDDEIELVNKDFIIRTDLVKTINNMVMFDKGENELLTPFHSIKEYQKRVLIDEGLAILGFGKGTHSASEQIRVKGMSIRKAIIYRRQGYEMEDFIKWSEEGREVVSPIRAEDI